MLDLSLFRSPRFVGVQVLAASPAFLFIALIALLPGRFIGIDGYSALQAGQLMIGLAAPLLVVPFLAALLTRWFRPGLLSAIGLIAVAAGLIWLADVMASGAAGLWMPMLLIGCGIGLPWGLMDAMAVSVVDARNVGMATGIFNTVRVSADGVAIAVLSALLALLIQTQLSATLPDAQSGPLNAQALVMAANRAALGQLDEAAAQLPHAKAQAMPLLHDAYDAAFRHVLHALAGIAVLTALCITLLLGRRETVAARLSPPATS
jgi:hypothetical protein